jgi:hypothetical protein
LAIDILHERHSFEQKKMKNKRGNQKEYKKRIKWLLLLVVTMCAQLGDDSLIPQSIK